METSSPKLPTKIRPVNPLRGRDLYVVETRDHETGKIRRTTNPIGRRRAWAKVTDLATPGDPPPELVWVCYEGEIAHPVALNTGVLWPDPKEAA